METERAALDAAIEDFEAAIDGVQEASTDEMLRNVMRRMFDAALKHEQLLERLVADSQNNNYTEMLTLSTRLIPHANALLQRIKGQGELRPLSDLIVGRTLIALLLGIIVSERAMPQMARMALRLFPQRAWIDGMVDILIYGLIEDSAR